MRYALFRSEGANCFRFGLDDRGRAYIGSTTDTASFVSDSLEALQALISAVKSGAADHLLRAGTDRPSPLCACAPGTPTVRSPSPPGAGPGFSSF
ncbi:hypothetical protein [Streptomyces brevispora]|uniref:hypothetical protein n=1 Tax=Streptomyces brevispora TaxID=887462 RepID=UPI002E35282D|nr:hypothetical protein [Streptomyces brevispora]